MKPVISRRNILKAIGVAPLALVVHVHDWQPEPSFWGYSCRCGAVKYAKDLH